MAQAVPVVSTGKTDQCSNGRTTPLLRPETALVENSSLFARGTFAEFSGFFFPPKHRKFSREWVLENFSWFPCQTQAARLSASKEQRLSPSKLRVIFSLVKNGPMKDWSTHPQLGQGRRAEARGHGEQTVRRVLGRHRTWGILRAGTLGGVSQVFLINKW